MFIHHLRRFNLAKNTFRRQKWSLSRVAPAGTHHICLNTQQPLYSQRFQTVLPFHSPGLAPVVDQAGAAFHVNDRGEDVYSQRFRRTFGFYQNLAAVQVNDVNTANGKSNHWHHITPEGSSAYQSVWQWCGNFQSYRCPVRDFDFAYYHIDPTGRVTSGPHSYAGDFREGSAVVRSTVDGLFHAIDENGNLLHSPSNKFLDLDVYHKSLARARDENGWFFIDRAGSDIGQGRRYRQIENFYNGQALVQLLHDGARCIIDEQHRIITRLHRCTDENRADIEQISKAYWPSFALKMGLEEKINLLDENKRNNEDSQLREQIRRVWNEMGFLEGSSVDGTTTVTERGRLLFDPNSITRARARYWLQGRYISAWLPLSSFPNRHISKTDVFSSIAKDPELVSLSQTVLNSYANEDWHGITAVLPEELLRSSTVVDLGGGIGALLRELSKYGDNQRLICVDRPEVIQLASSDPRIEFLSGDLFSGSLPSANYYILSRVLHDWPDAQVNMILNRIPSKQLCIIEREVDSSINQHALLSLHMFLINKAKERTRQEWKDLFSATNWSVKSRIPFSGHVITLLEKDNHAKQASTPLSSSVKSSVRKVVLPIAGLGTRMRPLSSILPKVLLPIVQHDGNVWKCRPVLDLLLQEIFADGTGIEQVLLVVAPEQLDLMKSYLSSIPHQNIDLILQPSPKGFGHAVLLTEKHIGNEPFVVMLSDHLFQSSHPNQSCLQQLLNAYRAHVSNTSTMGLTGVMTCTVDEVLQTGLFQSSTDMRNNQFFQITDMIEKPSIKIALDRFQSRTFSNRFLCQSGIDILPPSIFDQLRQYENQAKKSQILSELGLREAMNGLRQKDQLRGCLLDGHRFDTGNPRDYFRTFHGFATAKKRTSLQQNGSISVAWPFVQQIDQVRALFSASKKPIYSASAPGRLDVMGGFADYSGSRVLQYPIAERTHAFVQLSTEDTVRLISIQTNQTEFDLIDRNKLTIWEREIPMHLLHDHNRSLRERLETWYTEQKKILSPDEPATWPNYIVGVLSEMLGKTDEASMPIGFNIVIISNVPCNKGVASSAALEVAVARAVSACLHVDHLVSNTELALLCQFVENDVVGSSCGFMDQMTCVHACADHFFSLLCQHTPDPPFHSITIPSNIQLFGIDSDVKRSTASSAYRRIRTASFMSKQLMNLSDDIDHLCQISPSKFNSDYRKLLPKLMRGSDFPFSSHLDRFTNVESHEVYPLNAATTHPIEENFRVQLFEQLLQIDHHLSRNSLAHLGELMFQSDAGYVSCDLHHEQTSLLVDLIRQRSLSSNILFGAKITGGGGGGTVVVLAQKNAQAIEVIEDITNKYETITGRHTRIFSGSSSGLVTYSPMSVDML